LRTATKQKAQSGHLQATAEEQAAIRAMFRRRAECAPAGAGVGQGSALAWAGLKVAAMVLLAAGVAVGYLDGDEFDDVGCTVAQQPGGTSHGTRSAQAGERPDGKGPSSDGGSAGGSGGGGPGGRPECEVRAALCAHRMPDGQCQRSNRQCRLLAGALNAAIEGDPATGHFCIRVAPANEGSQPPSPPSTEPNHETLSLAAKVFQLLTALDHGSRLRKASPFKVFMLRYRQNFLRSEIARTCHCDKSLVALRLETLQETLPWQPQQLRELSAHVEAMQDAVNDSRATRIYRKSAVYGDEEGREGVEG
jgi:hypothetical protein